MITYFIWAKDTPYVKIGRCQSRRATARLDALQTGCPCKLVLLGTVERDIEKELHKRHRDSRERGEWFELSPSLRELLVTLLGTEATKCIVEWSPEAPRKPTIDYGEIIRTTQRFLRFEEWIWAESGAQVGAISEQIVVTAKQSSGTWFPRTRIGEESRRQFVAAIGSASPHLIGIGLAFRTALLVAIETNARVTGELMTATADAAHALARVECLGLGLLMWRQDRHELRLYDGSMLYLRRTRQFGKIGLSPAWSGPDAVLQIKSGDLHIDPFFEEAWKNSHRGAPIAIG